jgi:hypothetical protein
MSTDPSYYTSRITSEHIDKPKFFATVLTIVQGLVDEQTTLLSLPGLYDLDNAVGVQLDAVGLWVFGRAGSRYVDVPFGSGNLTALDDAHYRTLLRARIISNEWDGTVGDAYRAWSVLFQGTGLQVAIQDYQNMAMGIGLLGPSDAETQAMFLAGLLELKPSGVAVTYYIGTPPPPLFQAVAQAPQTLAATGRVLAGGALALAQAAQILAAAGRVGSVLRLTQAAQTLVAAGTILVRGTLGAAQAPQTLVATGGVVGLHLTQAAQTLAAAGHSP